jgi:hypothetical protein
MLISEIEGWHYVISWDNPQPADSSSMRKALTRLGKLYSLKTKTSVVLAPKSSTSVHDVRAAIRDNLNAVKGNAFYVNLKSGKGFQISMKHGGVWKSAAGPKSA